MQEFYNLMTVYSDKIATEIWSYMIYLLFIAGLWLTWKTGFIQFRKLGTAAKVLFRGAMKKKQGDQPEGDVSPFAALATALAATVGNGNIAGVATALYWGGPGAIFWMWVCGFLGMATKYAEATLGIYYREKHPDGTIAGGPMYYIKNGLKNKKIALYLAGIFAACGAFASLFGTGNMMQSNQMTSVLSDQLGFTTFMGKMLASHNFTPEKIVIISKFVLGFIVTFLVGLVVLGGLKRISRVAEKVVPTMIVIYLGFGLYILLSHITSLPAVFELIFSHAFTPCAAVGGFLGATVTKGIQFGFRRGLLSNEAGLGSAPIAHAAAQSPSAVHQGLIGTMEVFIDTIIVCTMTGLINLATGEWQGGVNGIGMTVASFSKSIPHIFGLNTGGIVVALCSILFGYTTIIGWCYYGEQCAKYLFGLKITYIYRICYVLLTFVGCVVSIELAFFVGDIANAIMALPNLVALILLSGTVGLITKEFFQKYPKIEDFEG